MPPRTQDRLDVQHKRKEKKKFQAGYCQTWCQTMLDDGLEHIEVGIVWKPMHPPVRKVGVKWG
jgi:hypothetical protein